MKCRLDEAQVGIKIARRNISNLNMQMIPLAECMKLKEKSEKAGLQLNIQNT